MITMRVRNALHPPAAALHQGCPVSIFDLDVVLSTKSVPLYFKEGELQPQHLAGLHLDPLRLLESIWVFPRVVWGHNCTCGITVGRRGIKILVVTSFNRSPLLPHPCAGQSWGYSGFQTPAPLEEESSVEHVRSTSHWPQQHLPARCPFPLSTRLSCLQSRAPGRVQGSPTVGGTGREEQVPGKISA